MRFLKHLKNRYIYILIFIFAVFLIVYFFIFKYPVFKISELEIKGIEKLNTNKVYGALSRELLMKGVFSVSEDYVESKVNEKIPQFRLIEYSVIFPNKISITLEKRDQKYVVKTPNGVFILDSTGFVLEEVYKKRQDAINVYYDKNLIVGEEMSDDVLAAALIYSELDQGVEIENGTITIKLEEGGRAFLPNEISKEKVQEYLTMLQKILQKYTIENKSIDLIDLRYSKPVIKFN